MQNVTLKYLAERVLRTLERGDVSKDVQLDTRDIMPVIREKTAYVIKGEWMNLKNQKTDAVNAQFIATFEGDVEYDETRKRYYTNLPAIPISLPDNTGVRSVRPVTNDPDKNKSMIPVQPDAMDLYGEMDSGFLEGMWGVEMDRSKIWYLNKPDRTVKEDGIEKVRIRMVTVSPQDTPADSPYPMSDDLIDQIIALTLEHFAPMASEEKDVIADERDT